MIVFGEFVIHFHGCIAISHGGFQSVYAYVGVACEGWSLGFSHM